MAQEKMKDILFELNISALKPHPRNEEFFSNITGKEFDMLVESIERDGVLTPLRVASDMTIISGHQRLRACQKLGIQKVPVLIDDSIVEEDDKLRLLIASNFGRMKDDPIKQGRYLEMYERLKGVVHGGTRKGAEKPQITQEDVARELGTSVTMLKCLKSLLTLVPDLQDAISEGRITATTGYKVLTHLSEDEQRELLSQLPASEKFTQKQIESRVAELRGEYDGKIKELEKEKESLEKAKEDAELERDMAEKERKLIEENSGPERDEEIANLISEIGRLRGMMGEDQMEALEKKEKALEGERREYELRRKLENDLRTERKKREELEQQKEAEKKKAEQEKDKLEQEMRRKVESELKNERNKAEELERQKEKLFADFSAQLDGYKDKIVKQDNKIAIMNAQIEGQKTRAQTAASPIIKEVPPEDYDYFKKECERLQALLDDENSRNMAAAGAFGNTLIMESGSFRSLVKCYDVGDKSIDDLNETERGLVLDNFRDIIEAVQSILHKYKKYSSEVA